MGAPDLKGLLPTMIAIFGLIGWGNNDVAKISYHVSYSYT